MHDIVFREPHAKELEAVSAQIAVSYKAAYQGLMLPSYLNALPENHWVPILEECFSRGDVCLLADIKGDIAGSVVYGRSPEHPDNADWHAIYLSPQWTGQGVGHRLYSEMEDRMCRQGFRCCTLEVLTGNKRAIRFYMRHGYEVCGTFTVKENGMELECHTMKKMLCEQ